MAITNIQDMDGIDWSRASDQFGDIRSDAASSTSSPTDVTVEAIDGVTYVVTTFADGNIQLHKYELTDTAQPHDPVTNPYIFVKLGEHQGRTGGELITSTGDGFDSPQIEKFGDTLVITVAAEEDQRIAGFTYDLANPPADPNQDGIDFHPEFIANQKVAPISTTQQEVMEKFTLSNGETYYLQTDTGGSMVAGQVAYDQATNQLTWEINQNGYDGTAFLAEEPYLSNGIYRQDALDNGVTIAQSTSVREAEFEQVGDVIYGYHAGPNGLQVTKWELDENGNMTGAQVVYTDGTTTKDLYDLGIVNTRDYPETSPANGAATLADFGAANTGSWGSTSQNWLQEIAGVVRSDANDGSRDALDFTSLGGVETFTIDGQMYMFTTTWGGSQDGFAVFTVDSSTGLPTEMIGMVEADTANNLDADDVNAIDQAAFSEITVSKLDATGEYVITVGGGDGLYHMGFDPTKSSTQNQQGALEWIGVDKGAAADGGSYSTDTDPTNTPVSSSSGQTQFDILPDGKVISTDVSGLWLGDPGISPICFAEGTFILTDQGETPVEALKVGDLVLTKDNGLKEVKWIGSSKKSLAFNHLKEKFAPVRISAGALGNGLPQRDLYVSQQHRIMLKSKIAQRIVGSDEILVPAKKLLGMDGIEIFAERDEVTYVHFLFDQHEIVYSNGAETESLFTGPEALKAVSNEGRAEIFSIFPELSDMDREAKSARIIPPGKVAKQITGRIKKNDRRLYEMLC